MRTRKMRAPIRWEVPAGAQVFLGFTECDSWTQRTFFCTFEFDSRGSKLFGTCLESNWYTLVGHLIEILPADDVREGMKWS